MMDKKYHWLIIFTLLLAASCARQSSPTGGPKDTIPPILIRSLPSQNQINYSGKTIELTFSEMIILNNAKEQIIIAPTTANPYDISYKKNKVTMKFEQELHDSVTYSINFREAVQDINEKNLVENLQLAFSTGSYIDSLSIAGVVTNPLRDEISKEATVAIFASNDTLSIFKHKPSYLTKTNIKGEFRLNNLKPGEYTLYAFEDKNRNLIADSKTEAYAFKSQRIILRADTAGILLPLVKLDARPLKLTSLRPYNNYFNIKTSKNMSSYKARYVAGTDSLITSFGEDRANVRVYNAIHTDSTLIAFSAIDSIGNKLDSSFYIKFNTRNTTPEKFSANIDKISLLEEKGIFQAFINFNKPTFLINTDSLLFLIDSAHVIPISSSSIEWDTLTNQARITKKIDPALFRVSAVQAQNAVAAKKQAMARRLKNQFIIGKGTFISIDNDTVTKFLKDVIPLKTEDLGVLVVKIQTKESSYVTQLLDKDFNIIRTSRNQKQTRWDDLPPGSYRIRLIIDKNNNGKWDPGNYLTRHEPEPITYYQNPKISPVNTTFLKANWEVDDLLITY